MILELKNCLPYICGGFLAIYVDSTGAEYVVRTPIDPRLNVCAVESA